MMRILSQWNGGSMLISEGERWKARRREMLPSFASKRLPGYGERIVARTSAMLDDWETMAGKGPLTLDTDASMVALTLDIAADTLFGEPLGKTAGEAGKAVAVLSETAFRESTNPLRLPDWIPLPANSRKRRAVALMKGIVERIVTDRLRKPEQDRGDLLSTLIQVTKEDDATIRDEVMTLLIAGHETTGATLSWACLLLSRHREDLARLVDEIDAALAGRLPRSDDLARMPLLRATVDEVLRLYPPAYALFPRRAVEDVEAGGALIHRGDLVQVVPYVTQRDARWFDEPAEFRPGRFMATPAWPRYAYLPFGAGPRVCIGQGFGIMEVSLALASLFQRFIPLAPEQDVRPEPRFSPRPAGGLRQEWVLRSRRTP